jgi:3-methyladenine DNA glycosylase AlkD
MGSTAAAIVAHLRTLHDPRNVAGRRRFGIASQTEQLGIPTPVLRALARPHRRDHALALALWAHPLHEARVLATLIADPAQITRRQAAAWVKDCDNWAATDALAFLLDRTPFAETLAHAWSARRAEYVKRTGFAIMAGMAVRRKELPHGIFLRFLPVVAREATDERNFVKKAANWALRQISKRHPRLRRAAIAEAKRIQRLESRAARWIAADALRELTPIKLRNDTVGPALVAGPRHADKRRTCKLPKRDVFGFTPPPTSTPPRSTTGS